ncbi:hypothetical protein [Fusobacterium ulcerans]|uniref:hypothetical protein n=1 Tax=Fusobacterium ulcerans TaxID=861 RepID=UPI001D0A1DF9|nr:hypothetical protein [Fusobacterium ulcerans]MCB8564076.1 hypothetical protein [Fusobacterium ulcerans]MCB8648422.1 hypothetical protein [Fusobacterium ulcerans]
MEKYLITKEKKENYMKEFPVLNCAESIGIDYDGYVSVKCKKLSGTCTYRISQKEEYKNCRLLTK